MSKDLSRVIPPPTEGAARLQRVLGLPSLVFFGLVYMVPLTVYDTYGIVSFNTGGRTALAYVVTFLAMIFTAVSYAAMVKVYPVAGSAYTFSSKTFGPNLGFLAGWSLLLDYVLLPLVNYLLIALYLHEAFPMVPVWAFMVGFVSLVTVLNIVGISTVASVSNLIVLIQFVFIMVFMVMSALYLSGVAHTVDLTAPFTGDGGERVTHPALFAGAAVLCLSFLGFDAISTMVEEAKQPLRDIPRAIVIVTAGAGLLFFAIAFVSQLVLPGTGFKNPETAGTEVMMTAGGQFLSIFFLSTYSAGTLGSAIAAQASVSRIMYSMGRDGVLPRRFFGMLSARFKTPVLAILLVSAISLIGMQADPDLLFSIVSFGALVAFSAVNLAVIRHYLVKEQRRGWGNLLRFGLMPTLGLIMTLWIWTSLMPLAFRVGLYWLGAGVLYLALLTKGFSQRVPEVVFSDQE